MSLEIQAALIAGVLSGLVVFGGIAAENQLEKRRRRSLLIEEKTLELGRVVMEAAPGFTLSEVDRSRFSPWFEAQGRALALTHEIRLKARGRKYRTIAREAERHEVYMAKWRP